MGRIAFSNYLKLAKQLVATEPGNSAWIMEMSYAHTNLAALSERNGKNDAEEAMSHMRTSVKFLERALSLEPDNIQYQREYVRVLSWLADAQMRLCNLDGARETRQKNEAMARELKAKSPANHDLAKEHADSLLGLGIVQKQTGLNYTEFWVDSYRLSCRKFSLIKRVQINLNYLDSTIFIL